MGEKRGSRRAHRNHRNYAQNELTDIVFVELPKVGRKVKKGDSLGVVESVKTVSDNLQSSERRDHR